MTVVQALGSSSTLRQYTEGHQSYPRTQTTSPEDPKRIGKQMPSVCCPLPKDRKEALGFL